MASWSLEEFERDTDRAFSFLRAMYAYEPLPAEKGGFHGTALVRRFVRDEYEVLVAFGDADSQLLCEIVFRDDLNEEIVERHYMARTLSTLLKKRYPDYVHPSRADLSVSATPQSIVSQYADLLGKYADDVLRGDFSAFPTLVYVLHHADREFPVREVIRFLGVYSTYENACAAIRERRYKRGFSERSDGFAIWKVQLDGFGCWYAGIPLDSAREHQG